MTVSSQPVADRATYDGLLRFKVEQGLREYGKLDDPVYRKRMEYELEVIGDMGFSPYFLIVADLCAFMRSAKPRPIRYLVRGSGCGSLCVWALKISHRWLDPIFYGIAFERFLNRDRVSNPDLDIDIDDTRRHEVVEYTTEKYGPERVARICTFGTLGAKAAINDIARAQQLPDYQSVAQRITSLISGKPGTKLAEELAKSEALRDEEQAYPDLFRIARRVEGKVRQPGVHAAGTIIAPDDMNKFVPLYYPSPDKREDEFPATQADMYDCETIGLLKMDYLGLKTLRVIEHSEILINAMRRAQGLPADFSVDHIPQNDRATWQLLADGKLAGVFQVEKPFVRNFARRMNLAKNMDPWQLAILVAIIRPGMMDTGFTERYLKRASGEEVPSPPHPLLQNTLKRSLGVLCFQEDVMGVAVDMGGFTMGQADVLRKGVGKKKPEFIAKMYPKFLKGAMERGATEDEVKYVWSLIEAHARYSFNNAHAGAYGIVGSYQTAYLKANYPLIFMTCLINSEAGGTSKEMGYNWKVAEYCEEARQMGLKVSKPSVRTSGPLCRFDYHTNTIEFGLTPIKGVSDGAADWIVKHCRDATTLYEFVLRCYEVVSLGCPLTRKAWKHQPLPMSEKWLDISKVSKDHRVKTYIFRFGQTVVFGKAPDPQVALELFRQTVNDQATLVASFDVNIFKALTRQFTKQRMNDDRYTVEGKLDTFLREGVADVAAELNNLEWVHTTEPIEGRVDHRAYTRVGQRDLDSLCWAGAFDCYFDNDSGWRPAIAKALPILREAAEKYHDAVAKVASGGSFNKVKEGDDWVEVTPETWKAAYYAIPIDQDELEHWTQESIIEKEREITGCYLSHSPFEPFVHLEQSTGMIRPSDLLDGHYDRGAFLGVLRSFRVVVCKKGQSKGREMAFMTVSGIDADLELVCFPDAWERITHKGFLVEAHKVYAIYAKRDARGGGLICDDMTRYSDTGLGR